MGELADRRVRTSERIKELRARLQTADTIATGKACVYATGSFGRCEASRYSDLDLFILGKSETKPGRDKKESSLSRLDEILIKADLIEATRELGIPEFSGDGRYLVHYAAHELTDTLGKLEDDVTNTFTARLLLLLESRPLLEGVVYNEVTRDVVAAYWRDYEDHKTDFMPAFLGNDIIRLWRTFCVNYEAGTEREPEEKKAKGKLKNYKLKHSRLLTCYSAVLHLLAIYEQQKSVHPQDVLNMITLTPTGRLEWLRDQTYLLDAKDTIEKLIQQYERFLEATDAPEPELINRFMDKEQTRRYFESASEFGNLVFDALTRIGKNTRFHRLLVV